MFARVRPPSTLGIVSHRIGRVDVPIGACSNPPPPPLPPGPRRLRRRRQSARVVSVLCVWSTARASPPSTPFALRDLAPSFHTFHFLQFKGSTGTKGTRLGIRDRSIPPQLMSLTSCARRDVHPPDLRLRSSLRSLSAQLVGCVWSFVAPPERQRRSDEPQQNVYLWGAAFRRVGFRIQLISPRRFVGTTSATADGIPASQRELDR